MKNKFWQLAFWLTLLFQGCSIIILGVRLRHAEKNTGFLYQHHAELQTNINTLDISVLQLQEIAQALLRSASNQPAKIIIEMPSPPARRPFPQASVNTDL